MSDTDNFDAMPAEHETADPIQLSLAEDDGAASASDDMALNLDFGTDEDEPADDLALHFAEEPAQTTPEPVVDEVAGDETAEEEAALEALRQQLRTQFGDWYVVHTYSGMENRVKQNLDSRVKTLNMEDFIFETIVPTEDVVEIRNGVRKTVTRTVLPGYVLVRMELTDESWSTVRHTPSVTGFVGQGNTPVALSLTEVENMLAPAVRAKVAAASAGSTPRRAKKTEVVDFTVGDSVMVTDGPFAGVHATITEINVNNQRLKALVEILGRDTPVDLTFPQIQKV